MAFDPCREWLGIAAHELSDPRRVLGLPQPLAGDAEAVMRAASVRLESLGRVSPGPFAKAHAALIARVEAARDTLLAEALAGGDSGSESGDGTSDTGPAATFPPIATGRAGSRRRRRKSSGSGGLVFLAIALLGVGTAVLAFFVLRPDKQDRPADRIVAAADTRPREPEPAAPLHDKPPQTETRNGSAADSERQAAEQRRWRKKREADEQARREAANEQSPQAEDAALTEEQANRAEAERRQAEAQRARLAAAVNDAIAKAYAALRREDFDTADQLLAAVDDRVGDDVEAATRLERWRLLAGYAREFTRFREQALTAANRGRDYEVDGDVFAIIEITPDEFVYRQEGANKRVPRGEVDPRLTMAIAETWFAGDGRAANHLFLGAGWLCLDPPDLRRARAAWQLAGAGGEQVGPLLDLLNEPVVRKAGR
jgi:hypothetical protein